MTVRSEPTPAKPAARDLTAPPLSRATIDHARPWIRLLLGAALIAFSGYTTITGVGKDFAPLLQGTFYGIPLTIIGGLGVAIFLSFGEWLTSEQYPIVYTGLLLLDARYTQQQIGPSIDALARYHLSGVHPLAPFVVALALSWIVALAIARYGEILLFGKRK